MDNKLIGFDTREMFSTLMERNKSKFPLLKPDVQMLLSADWSVWPSVFDFDDGLEYSESLYSISERKTVQLPDKNVMGHVNYPLWGNLNAMLGYLREYVPPIPEPYWSLAFTVHEIDVFTKDFLGYWPQISFPPTPPSVQRGWDLLGYDVVDCGFFSAIICWRPSSIESDEVFIKNWRDRLNHFHLFSRIEDASEFRIISNSITVSHAPFFVCGIWRIKTDLE